MHHHCFAEEKESPYNDQARKLLAQPDGSMPEAITRLDAQIVNTICNEIVESSHAISWDDIAGAPHVLVVRTNLSQHVCKQQSRNVLIVLLACMLHARALGL